MSEIELVCAYCHVPLPPASERQLCGEHLAALERHLPASLTKHEPGEEDAASLARRVERDALVPTVIALEYVLGPTVRRLARRPR